MYVLSIIAKSEGVYPLSDFIALLMLALEELEKLESEQEGFLIEPIEFDASEKDGKLDLNLFVHRGKNIALAEKLIGKVAKI